MKSAIHKNIQTKWRNHIFKLIFITLVVYCREFYFWSFKKNLIFHKINEFICIFYSFAIF